MDDRARTVARGLAWFGIGLGVAEVLAPRSVARLSGLGGWEATIRLFGAREIASGVLLLRSDDPRRVLLVRVAGDLLDGWLLGRGIVRGGRNRSRALLATAAVAPVVALDVLFARWTSVPSDGR